MADLGHNRLGELAALIREAHADTRSAAQRAAERALEAGRHLLEAKATLKHGQWSGWLKDSVGFSERTAQRYMQLVRSGMESATVADLGIRGAAEKIAAKKMGFHPYTDAFPLLEGEEFAALVEDIRAHGQLLPIVITKDNLILDGRNRYLACLEAGVDPIFRLYEGTDENIIPYLESVNLTRAHLTNTFLTIEQLAKLIEEGSKTRAIESKDPGWLERAVSKLVDELSPDMREELEAAIEAHPSVAVDPSRFRLDANNPSTREALKLFIERMKAQQ
jgi:hypothetical protein